MNRFWKIIINKYFITFLVFLVIMVFFDQNNFIAQSHRNKQLETTENNISFLSGEINRMENELYELNHNDEKLEKYAREKYHQKRDHEDTYLIIVDSTSEKN